MVDNNCYSGFKFFEPNFICQNACAHASDNSECANYALSDYRHTAWKTRYSADGQQECITINLPQSVEIDRLFLLNHNLKNYTVSLCGGNEICEPYNFANIQDDEIGYSQYWCQENLSIQPDTIINPDGNTYADGLVANNQQLPHILSSKHIEVTGNEYTASCYVKAGLHSTGILQITDENNNVIASILFNLNAVTTSIEQGSPTHSIVDEGNSWYKVSLTSNINPATDISLNLVLHNGTTTSFIGDGETISLYLWNTILVSNATCSFTNMCGIEGKHADGTNLNVTNYNKNTSYYEFDKILVKQIVICCDYTQNSQQKFISTIIATQHCGTLLGYPEVKKASFTPNDSIKKNMRGVHLIKDGYETFSVDLNFRANNKQEDVDLINKLRDRCDPFYIWLNSNQDYFVVDQFGWRLQDLFLVKDYGRYDNGWNSAYSVASQTKLKLRETINWRAR